MNFIKLQNGTILNIDTISVIVSCYATDAPKNTVFGNMSRYDTEYLAYTTAKKPVALTEPDYNEIINIISK